MRGSELFHSGNLIDAVAATEAAVKARPSDIASRLFLSELLLFTGDLLRADQQLATIIGLDPKGSHDAMLLRQVLRAEVSRQECFGSGRTPEFLVEPSRDLRLRLLAAVAMRENRASEALRLVEEADAVGPTVRGRWNGEPFEDLRDPDDLTSSFFEVLTTTGKYYWVPFDRIKSIAFHPPERAFDLFARRCRIVVREGPDGEVYIPVLYPGSAACADDGLRLGRKTDWIGGDGAPVRGQGRRILLFGDRDSSLLEVGTIEFSAAVGTG